MNQNGHARKPALTLAKDDLDALSRMSGVAMIGGALCVLSPGLVLLSHKTALGVVCGIFGIMMIARGFLIAVGLSLKMGNKVKGLCLLSTLTGVFAGLALGLFIMGGRWFVLLPVILTVTMLASSAFIHKELKDRR